MDMVGLDIRMVGVHRSSFQEPYPMFGLLQNMTKGSNHNFPMEPRLSLHQLLRSDLHGVSTNNDRFNGLYLKHQTSIKDHICKLRIYGTCYDLQAVRHTLA